MNDLAPAQDVDRNPLKPTTGWGRWLVIGIAIALVAIPFLWSELPAEVARWYTAAAAESELDGDFDRAVQQVNQAIRWYPTNSDLFAYRAHLHLGQQQLEAAMKDTNRALELMPDGSLYALYQHVLASQRSGEHDQALASVDKIVALAAQRTPPRRLPTGQVFGMTYDSALNLRAYSRALAETQIDAGLKDMAEAFSRIGSEDVAAYLDTRGYLYFLDGDRERALADLNKAVDLVEATRTAFDQQPPVGDRRSWDEQSQLYREELAVILHHRGLAHDALGHEQEAEEDFRRAEEFGYDPDKGVW